MSMTEAYLRSKCTPVTPKEGGSYRVIGYNIGGAIYQVEKIDNGICYFKGYIKPKEISKMSFYEIDNEK